MHKTTSFQDLIEGCIHPYFRRIHTVVISDYCRINTYCTFLKEIYHDRNIDAVIVSFKAVILFFCFTVW